MWIIFFLGFKLTGHVMETLVTDVYDCGLRCLRNGKCRSYNSQADGNHGNMTCELSDQRRETRPEDMRRSPGFIYFGKSNNECYKNRINLEKNMEYHYSRPLSCSHKLLPLKRKMVLHMRSSELPQLKKELFKRSLLQ